MSTIEVKDVSFCYDRSEVLKDLSFAVEAGSFVAIAGPNGAGKTTLLGLLSGSLEPRCGTVRIDDREIGSYDWKGLAGKVAVVRQQFVPEFSFTVMETVMMARTVHLGLTGFESEHDREVVAAALEATDTMQFAARTLGQISGGERQRVFIARALAQETSIILLDEPTSFLDLRHQVGVFDLLKKMQTQQNKTIVTVTHDINLAAQYCDNVLLLGRGGTYYTGLCRDVFTAGRIRDVFGVEGFEGQVGREKFFLPLGSLARDYGA